MFHKFYVECKDWIVFGIFCSCLNYIRLYLLSYINSEIMTVDHLTIIYPLYKLYEICTWDI